MRMDHSLTERLASDIVLDDAYRWLCARREHHSHKCDVWDVRWRWDELKPRIQENLRAGNYAFDPMREIRAEDEIIELWSARDALVLKALSRVLSEHLDPIVSKQCRHIVGRGGAKRAVQAAKATVNSQDHVMKSDVKGYYASIDHFVLYELLRQCISDGNVLRLLWGYMRRTVCYGGTCREVTRGISLRCSLSPLMGALSLKPLDDAVQQAGFFYARFMDDWVIIAPTRWKLRRAVSLVNRTLAFLKLEKHPDKTFIGKASRGFDFLGYSITPSGISVAQESLQRLDERITRLYEHGADIIRIGRYIRRWIQWAVAGIKNPITSKEAWQAVYEFYNTSSSSGQSRRDPFVPPKYVRLLAPTTVPRADCPLGELRGTP